MPTFLRGRWGVTVLGTFAVLLAIAVTIALSVVVHKRIGSSDDVLSIRVLSSRPDQVTGGDARLLVTATPGQPLGDIRVELNGADVTSQLTVTDLGLEGVVRGLAPSVNRVEATAPQVHGAALSLTNHPLTGPLFSGTQLTPFICQSPEFRTRTGVALGEPLDDKCSISTSVSYLYFSTAQQKLVPLSAEAASDPTKRPADIATVEPAEGQTRPFIVKVETATIDRGIAQIATLDDPGGTMGTGWNRKLIYAFGGDCGGGHRQGTRAVGIMSPNLLSKGFALASNSLNAFEQNCNDVVAAEAFAMTREHFIETYGAPTYTMGIGCSGGAAQMYQIADNYPGLLDGVVAGCSVADLGFDVGQLAFDARLLTNFAARHPGVLSSEQLVAVSGMESLDALRRMSDMARILDPTAAFDPAIPRSERFAPIKNVPGARSTIWDQTINVYGVAQSSSRARRPLGNVGVQYGLEALREGTITVSQFIELNARIGGLNVDLGRTARRTTADGAATRLAYSTGRLLNGGGGLGDIPIIDYRSHDYGSGAPAPLDQAHHTFVVRSRLVKARGDADNMVLLADSGHGRFVVEGGVVGDAIMQMDRWISEMKRLGYRGHRAAVESKPTDLVDACWTADGRKIAEPQSYGGTGECSKLYPAYATPRMVAGGPLTSDVVACRRTDIDSRDYGQRLSLQQIRQLEAIFPAGVCDWTKGGRWQRGLSGTWQSF